MQRIKIILYHSILISFALGSPFSYAAESTVTKTATISLETIAGKTVEGLSLAGPYVSVASQALSIAMEIKTHTFPSEEEKSHANAVAERYSSIVTEKEFENCLRHNRSTSERGSSGRPAACEDIARMLIMLGGKDEVNRMTTIYNQFRK